MKILLDADAILATIFEDQSTHKTAIKILTEISNRQTDQLYILNITLQETATVISKKYNQAEAKKFYLTLLKDPPIILKVDDILEQKSWEIFLEQTKKGTSFIDCANLSALSYYNFDKIFSFDEFYPKTLRLL